MQPPPGLHSGKEAGVFKETVMAAMSAAVMESAAVAGAGATGASQSQVSWGRGSRAVTF